MVLRSLRTSWAKLPLIPKVTFSPRIGDFLLLHRLIVPSIMFLLQLIFIKLSSSGCSTSEIRSVLDRLFETKKSRLSFSSNIEMINQIFGWALCLFLWPYKNIFHMAGFHNIWINHVDKNVNVIDHMNQADQKCESYL